MDVKEEIIRIITEKGPALPAHLSRELKIDSLFISAHLSEMAANKKLKISCLKVGSSPLYLLPGQEPKVEGFIEYLNEKDRKAFILLKEHKILDETKQEPLIRVSLRNIKDFAVPLKVNHGETSSIFWKFYDISTEEAEQLIRQVLSNKHPEQKKEQEREKTEEKPKPIEKQQKIEAPLKEKKETESKLRPIPTPKKETTIQDFLETIVKYFQSKDIIVLEKDIIRKNSEIDFVIEIPSAVGNLVYYCKAKNKKRINDGDLSSTFMVGQTKKLAPLFLTTGEPTKRAKSMLDKEFQGLKFKKI